jgi:hypothetical protein
MVSESEAKQIPWPHMDLQDSHGLKSIKWALLSLILYCVACHVGVTSQWLLIEVFKNGCFEISKFYLKKTLIVHNLFSIYFIGAI